jgi:hypothetical protein
MDTLLRLTNLMGKHGLLKIRQAGEVRFTFLSVEPGPDLPTEMDDDGFQAAINQSSFGVLFENGVLIDGSNTSVISGWYISRIFEPY